MIVERKYSYEELAQALGITPRAARVLASQNGWRSVRQDGKVRVIVPSDALEGRSGASNSRGLSEARATATTQSEPLPRGHTTPNPYRVAAPHPADEVASLQIRIAGLEGQIKALNVRADAESRRADDAVQERNEWRAFAQVLAEAIPDGVRWWRRARN